MHGHRIVGGASWYGKHEQGHRTANGEKFDRHGQTCAHKSLPFNSLVQITDTDTGKSATCRINDRGPYIAGRVIDAAENVAVQLGIHDRGVAPHVRIEVTRWGNKTGAEPEEVAEAPPPPAPVHRHTGRRHRRHR